MFIAIYSYYVFIAAQGLDSSLATYQCSPGSGGKAVPEAEATPEGHGTAEPETTAEGHSTAEPETTPEGYSEGEPEGHSEGEPEPEGESNAAGRKNTFNFYTLINMNLLKEPQDYNGLYKFLNSRGSLYLLIEIRYHILLHQPEIRFVI